MCIGTLIHMKASGFVIQPSAPEPIFRQIAEQIRRLVASRQLVSGDLLPSVRDVAEFHAINPMTVSRAYSLLEAEGLLERLRGKGMSVGGAHTRPTSPDQRLALLDSHLRAVARQADELELPAALVLKRLRNLMEKRRGERSSDD
jgi:GntR family transcriptional regulator